MPPSRITLVSALLAVLVAAHVPAIARAGAVRGRVYLSRQAAVADSTGRSAALVALQAGIGDAVISIEPAPAKLEKRLAHKAAKVHDAPRVDQMEMKFIPRVMAVAAGDSVVFANLDSLYHNVFSISTARHFDLGRMPPGKIGGVRFERAGVINLHCELHPEMMGYVVVLPTRVYTRPDSLGSFTLPNLPRGHYVLHAWHPRVGDRARAFDVPRHGATRLAVVL